MPKGYPKKKTPIQAPSAPPDFSTFQDPAPPTREQLLYARGYDRGLQEGYNAAVQKMVAAVGLTLTPHGERAEGNVQQTPNQPEQEEEVERIPSPPPPPPSSTELRCGWCGHSREMHEPLNAKSCFFQDCKCAGWTEKAPLRLGKMKIRR